MFKSFSKLHLTAWLLAFCLIALGAKLLTYQIYGVNMPYLDQWDEARVCLKPGLEHRLTWADLNLPHNEHRILFTRALDLAEVKINGEWDIPLQIIVNALTHLAYGVALLLVLWQVTGRPKIGWFVLLLLPIFALPFGAENVVRGFQSQMYLVTLFGLLTGWGLGFYRPGQIAWVIGALTALAGLFTMASGMLAAAAVIGLLGLRCLRLKQSPKQNWPTLLVAGLIVLLGLKLQIHVPAHEQFAAPNLDYFIRVLLHNLSWPMNEGKTMWLIYCLPIILLALRYLRGLGQRTAAMEVTLLLAGWGFLQALVLAWGRAKLFDSCRYYDGLATLSIAGIAATWLLVTDRPRDARQPWFSLGALVWYGFLLIGLLTCTVQSQRNFLEPNRFWNGYQLANLRYFLAHDNYKWLPADDFPCVPYWNLDWMAEILRDPTLAPILPRDVRLDQYLPPAPASTPTHFISQTVIPHLPRTVLTLPGVTPADQVKLVAANGRITTLPPASSSFPNWSLASPPGPYQVEILSDHTVHWPRLKE
ncbi:MAG TPA: hypothetical protein VF607_05515, partial [Verrucomicrobiae bacterium]